MKQQIRQGLLPKPDLKVLKIHRSLIELSFQSIRKIKLEEECGEDGRRVRGGIRDRKLKA